MNSASVSPPIILTYTLPYPRIASPSEILKWHRDTNEPFREMITNARSTDYSDIIYKDCLRRIVAYQKANGIFFIDSEMHIFEPGKVVSITVQPTP